MRYTIERAIGVKYVTAVITLHVNQQGALVTLRACHYDLEQVMPAADAMHHLIWCHCKPLFAISVT